MAVAGDGSLGQGKSRAETGLAPLPPPALAQRSHPDLQRSWDRVSIYLSTPSRHLPGQRLVWAAKQALGKAALGALFA